MIAEADDFVYTRENSVDGNNFVDKGSLMTIYDKRWSAEASNPNGKMNNKSRPEILPV